MSLIITHTDIHNFLLCKRRWWFDFILDYRKPESLVGNLALGSRVHAALEHYYKGLGDPVAQHDVLFKADLSTLETDPETPPWAIDQMYKDAIIGRNCVEQHQQWLADEAADDEFTIEGVEQVVEAPLLDGEVLLRGKVDVLFRRKDNGFLVVNDLKSDGGRPGTREQLERSWQHHCYLIALRLSRPDEVVHECYYTVIRKLSRPSRATNPTVNRWRVPGTTRMADAKQRQLELICKAMLANVKAMGRDVDYAYPTPNHECQWCPYRQPCEVMDERPEAALAMLDREYIKGGRHARYGELS